MFFQVRHIGIFRTLLFFIRMVDQDIESICRRITVNDGKKLLLVQHHEILSSVPERQQEPLCLFTKDFKISYLVIIGQVGFEHIPACSSSAAKAANQIPFMRGVYYYFRRFVRIVDRQRDSWFRSHLRGNLFGAELRDS
jgi:hypothetical protein